MYEVLFRRYIVLTIDRNITGVAATLISFIWILLAELFEYNRRLLARWQWAWR